MEFIYFGNKEYDVVKDYLEIEKGRKGNCRYSFQYVYRAGI